VWLLDTSKEPSVWRDALKEAGDPNDEYLVARLSHNWASFKMAKSEHGLAQGHGPHLVTPVGGPRDCIAPA
jgi:hypothetical protein